VKLPITVIIAARNEEENLPACLRSVRFCDQVIVVDSQSTDRTAEISRGLCAEVHQFHYRGGWPKKRQWAMDNLPVHNPWVLLLDADERVTPSLRRELSRIITADGPADGYWITLRLVFLGRVLRHGASGLRKLSFFRAGRACFECLLADQTKQMADMEVHEHLVVDGEEGACSAPLLHVNKHDLFRYIQKHNEYSSWSAELISRQRRGLAPDGAARPASFSGNQAERRRAITALAWSTPGASLLVPVMRFLWFYLFRLGFLDGVPGFYYCGFKAVQAFHIAAKLHEKSDRRH
jgi:glycosyltransferase involved in cell wall biosynthesis